MRGECVSALAPRDEEADPHLMALAHAVGGAFRELDSNGLLPRVTARKLIGQIQAHGTPATLSPLYLTDAVLGPFVELPDAARAGILAAIQQHDRAHIAALDFGVGFARLLRGLWRGKLYLKSLARRQPRPFKAVSAAVDAACFAVRRLPGYVRLTARRSALHVAGRMGRARSLGAVLCSAGLEEPDLVLSFACAIPQEPSYRSYWDDLSRNRTVGKLIGIDLLPGSDGFWFIESNANPALVEERSALYGVDPLVSALIAAARQHGYRRLVYLDNNSDGVDRTFAGRLAAEAGTAGLDLVIHILPNVPTAAFARSYGLSDDGASDTLIVQPRDYGSSLDRILSYKAFTYAILDNYRARHDVPDLRVPTWSRRPAVSVVGVDEPFPNLVYKQPNLDQGQGLAFVKARDQAHADRLAASIAGAVKKSTLKDRVAGLVADQSALWQAYVVPRFAKERRPYIVRAHLLLSPRGVRFLSAHRVVSHMDVPHQLDFGTVADARPYLVNRSTGGTYAIVPASEEPKVRQSALDVGRGLAQAIGRAFATRAP